jgi:hypothetical protein
MRLSCREASRLLSQRLERRLAFGERIALRLHLTVCDACTRLDAQLAFLRRAMDRLGGEEDGREASTAE